MVKQANSNEDIMLLLATNHRYFLRETVATVCRLVILGFICTIATFICSGLAAAMTASVRGDTAAAVGFYGLAIILWIIYLVVAIVYVARLLTLHKEITKVEDSFNFEIDGQVIETIHEQSRV